MEYTTASQPKSRSRRARSGAGSIRLDISQKISRTRLMLAVLASGRARLDAGVSDETDNGLLSQEQYVRCAQCAEENGLFDLAYMPCAVHAQEHGGAVGASNVVR